MTPSELSEKYLHYLVKRQPNVFDLLSSMVIADADYIAEFWIENGYAPDVDDMLDSDYAICKQAAKLLKSKTKEFRKDFITLSERHFGKRYTL